MEFDSAKMARMLLMTWVANSCEQWEKFNRATFIPASMSLARVSLAHDANLRMTYRQKDLR